MSSQTGPTMKIGSYAQADDTVAWDSFPVLTVKKKEKGAKRIKHEIFLECAKFLEDPHWESIFKCCAEGSFPSNFSYKNNLIYSKGQKKVVCKSSKDYKKLATLFHDFFIEHGCSLSPQEAVQFQIVDREENWKYYDMYCKEFFITDYITRTRLGMKLSPRETQDLSNVLRRGITEHILGNDQILVHNCKIDRIRGLYAKEKSDGLHFYIDRSLVEKAEKKRDARLRKIESTRKEQERFYAKDEPGQYRTSNFYLSWLEVAGPPKNKRADKER